jgi:hypothetical protein
LAKLAKLRSGCPYEDGETASSLSSTWVVFKTLAEHMSTTAIYLAWKRKELKGAV